MSADRGILIVPYGHDPLDALAAYLLAAHRPEFPDLTRHTVLLPPASVQRFQRTLLRRTEALLPPAITSLAEWLRRYAPPQPALAAQQRELLFSAILNRFPALTARFGAWTLVDGLLGLFDDITLNIRALPPALADFETLLARGYGLPATGRFAALSEEARLVHSLYRAWHDHLYEARMLDCAVAEVAAMQTSLAAVPADRHFYVAGVLDWPRAALDWLVRLPCPATLVLQGAHNARDYHPDSVVTTLIETLDWPVTNVAEPSGRTIYLSRVFAPDGPPLGERAQTARADFSADPLNDHLSIFSANDSEQEARAVELQVRRWWLAGKRDIGVISNDRKLLRRVRALLERAQLPVLDRSGWPLSTTSAASTVMDWLACISTGFAPEPLLGFLRSPFASLSPDSDQRDAAIGAIEAALLNTRTGSGGLEAAIQALDRHARTLGARFGDDALVIAKEIAKRIRGAAAPLIALQQRRAVSHVLFCRTLTSGLDNLGVLTAYAADEAGNQLLALLDELTASAAAAASAADWDECAHWLRRAFERRHFHAAANASGVELAGLSDATLAHYEALVVAGCTADHLPAPDDASPFFNDAVRAELGLRTNADARNVQFNTFRRLLEAADHVLLTHRRADGNRPLTVSPWLERVQAFHRLAFADDASDPTLAALLADPQTLLSRRDTPPPPAVTPPHPVAPESRIPQRLTASGYQSLIDCPYQFYTRAVLGLEPPRPLEEELTAADYGLLVHRCLQAFHEGVAGLPGPWQGPLTDADLPAAEKMLAAIAEAAFAPHLRRTMTTRAWLYRWRRVATAYLQWQVHRQHAWPVVRCEQVGERTLPLDHRRMRLSGRIDRIDEAGDRLAIVDYKTGTLPRRDDIVSGEHVQLPFYGLLTPAVHEARLLGFEDDGINDRIVLAGDELHALVDAHEQRLTRLLDDMVQGAPLPAHGDAATCDRCAVATLCRRPLWQLVEPNTASLHRP